MPMLFIGYLWLLNLIWLHAVKKKDEEIKIHSCSSLLACCLYWYSGHQSCVHTEQKRCHTQIREITIDANQQTMRLQAGIQLKLSKKIPEETKQSSTKWFFSLDSLSHSLALSLALCYRQSIFKAETERYSQIQPMTVAPMSVDSILLLTCVSFSLCHWWSLLGRVPFVQSPSGTGTVETLMESGVTL